ncbi:MAG: hypothetical protein HY976_02050 [Candidatus Kerfeldbacteria bacterium]|nr:hypothetical protein [Candidatus Kerfeldbacteria bacterium]
MSKRHILVLVGIFFVCFLLLPAYAKTLYPCDFEVCPPIYRWHWLGGLKLLLTIFSGDDYSAVSFPLTLISTIGVSVMVTLTVFLITSKKRS